MIRISKIVVELIIEMGERETKLQIAQVVLFLATPMNYHYRNVRFEPFERKKKTKMLRRDGQARYNKLFTF